MALITPIDLKNCTFKIKDGTGTPNEISIFIGEGNLTFTERRNVEYILDRGNLAATRLGDEVPVDVSFEFSWIEVTSIASDTTPTPVEALKKIGAAASWVSTDADPCAPYCVDIEVTHAPICTSGTGSQDEVTLLSDFRWEELNYNFRDATISCTGKCNVTDATITRVP